MLFGKRSLQAKKKVPPCRLFFGGGGDCTESISVEYSDEGVIGVKGAVMFCDTVSGAGELGASPAGPLSLDE